MASAPGQGRLQDALLREVRVSSPGVPQTRSQQGLIGPSRTPQTFTVSIPATAVPGTIVVSAEVYPSSFAALIEALKRIITEPVVCIYCREGPAYWRSLALQTFDESSDGLIADIPSDLIASARTRLS